MEATDFWRKCSSCKKSIGFGAKHYVCSVSTCNGQRTGYVFCSVPCFEVHLPGARHKDAAAIEAFAPPAGRTSNRTIIATATSGATSSSPATKSAMPREVLVIASRFKEYVQARGDMNTAANTMDFLSDFLRVAADRAIDNARADGRKTVMDRDFHFLKK